MGVSMTYRLEWLFAFNLLLNLVWLSFSAFFAWTRPRWSRIGLMAAAGAVLAVLPAQWPDLAWLQDGWPTLFLAPVLVYLAVRPSSIRQFGKAMAGFMLFAGAAGGVALVLREWLEGPMAVEVGVVLVSVGAFVGGSGALWVWQTGRVTLPVQQSLYQLRLSFGGEWLQLTALLDSGHQLLTPVTRQPVAVVSLEQLRHLLPPEVIEAASGGWEALSGLPSSWRNRCQLLHYQSLGQPDGMILAVAPDQISVQRKGGGDWIEVRGAIGLSLHSLQGAYQALIPPQLLGEAAEK